MVSSSPTFSFYTYEVKKPVSLLNSLVLSWGFFLLLFCFILFCFVSYHCFLYTMKFPCSTFCYLWHPIAFWSPLDVRTTSFKSSLCKFYSQVSFLCSSGLIFGLWDLSFLRVCPFTPPIPPSKCHVRRRNFKKWQGSGIANCLLMREGNSKIYSLGSPPICL